MEILWKGKKYRIVGPATTMHISRLDDHLGGISGNTSYQIYFQRIRGNSGRLMAAWCPINSQWPVWAEMIETR